MKGLFALLSLLLLALPVHAEQAKKFGDVEVHYNAMPTDELLPDVAKSYKIERSRNRGMLTISVLKRTGLGVSQASKAEVKVSIPTLPGQAVEVPMREVVEGAAIYYIGEYRVTAPQTLKFAVTAKPEGSDKRLSFDFSREFYK
jgi:hypothetical protein